jgi:hypothetical protein
MVVTNKHGSVVLRGIGDIRHISEIRGAADVPSDCWLSIEQAEQIALITGNQGIQLSLVGHDFYVMVYPLVPHQNMVQIGKLESLIFTSAHKASELLEVANSGH